ncbi:MAG: hypothetical protein KKE37_00410 [Verrucomicrobia bacterium]|nr:hypothetical protein [Verrucomicrobiota bacterium]MBU4427798.1 hypothetical protein [Verrucomicrobiota bacterium]MCG2681375.1 hypothetical protein [Kiritimatiellia bacterium]
MLNQDWDIKPRGLACAQCRGAFTDKQIYVSQLTFGAGGYQRRDFCFECWAKRDTLPPSGSNGMEPALQPSGVSAESGSAEKAEAAPLPAAPQEGVANGAETREVAVSIWKGVFHPPPPPPEEPLKKETAESLLRSLIEKNDPTSKNVIFILAVMLERRRLLLERDVQLRDDGSTLRVYEHRHTGETFLIIDPNLDLNQLSHVQEEVMAMLGKNTETSKLPPPSDNIQQSTSNVQS